MPSARGFLPALLVALCVAPVAGAQTPSDPAPVATHPAKAPPPSIGAMVSATTDAALRPPRKPKLTLVLSGGGARGAAHVGVIKVLDRMGIAPDFVVGTSMGSVIGGLYSAGWSGEQIEEMLEHVDLGATFSDRVAREDKSFRRKSDDDLFLIPAKIKFKGGKPWLPPGVLGGNRLDLLLEVLEYLSAPATDFDDLPIPYRAVATDLGTGEAVVIGEGSIATAMRASMAVPAVFAPVSLNGRTLVDGGNVANLPIGIAQALGAERIIAVDITTPLLTAVEGGSFLTVMDQQTSFLTVANRLADVARLEPDDIQIIPDLGDISFSDFDRVREAIEVGEKAAVGVEAQLAPLKASPADWTRFVERRKLRASEPPIVDAVRIRNTAPIDDRIVANAVAVPLGKPLDPLTFPAQLLRLSAHEFFGKVETDFERKDGHSTLDVITRPRAFGRNTLQLGISLENDFEGSALYALTLRHQTLPLNRFGGEWQNLARVGSAISLVSELYQPLEPTLRWFVAPSVSYRTSQIDLYVEDQAAATYRLKGYGGALALGRVFGNWMELRAGAAVEAGDATLTIGVPGLLPNLDDDFGGWFVSAQVDTRNSAAFPRHGAFAKVTLTHQVESLGGTGNGEQVLGFATHSFSFGRNTIAPYVEAGTAFDDVDVTARSLYRLGGFGRLSGLAQDQLLGTRGGLGRLTYYFQWANLELGSLSTRAYAGMTAEIGNVFFEGDPIGLDTLRTAGSIFVGADTVIGPAFVAWGISEGGRRRIYLSIGRRL